MTILNKEVQQRMRKANSQQRPKGNNLSITQSNGGYWLIYSVNGKITEKNFYQNQDELSEGLEHFTR